MMKKIDETTSVAPQIDPDQIADLAEAGIALIINNRPDNEEAGQPLSDEVAAKAAEHGIEYRHIPMSAESLSLAQIDDFAEALEQADGAVLAFCRSGYRSALLWALARVRKADMDPDEAQESAASAGFDLSSALPVMKQMAGS